MTPKLLAAVVSGLLSACLCGCWRMQEVGGWSADGDDTGDSDSNTEGTDSSTGPDTASDGDWVWEEMPSPTDKHLADVWGTDFSNVWAVGEDGTIIHFDGESWSEITYDSWTKPNLHAIAGAAADVIWAAGADRFMLEFDGEQWEQQDTVFSGPETPGGYRDLCVKSAMDANVVGEGATIAEFNGLGWSYGVEAALNDDFHGVTCRLGSDAFIAGHDHAAFASSVLIRYDDWLHDWELMSHQPADFMYGIAGDGEGEVWAVGFDAGAGTRLYALVGDDWIVASDSPHQLLGLWASVGIGVWSVGNTTAEPGVAVIQAWNGGADPAFELVYDGTSRLRGVWGIEENGDRHVFAVGKHGAILHLYWEPS